MTPKIGRRLTDTETQKVAIMAAYIDASPHEWPQGVADIALLCHGYLDLQAELAEARKDGERLDEAARGQYSIRYNAMNEQWEVTTGALHPAHRRYACRKTIRAAIDAARGAK